MTKIGFVVTSLNSGGIENYLLRFLEYSKGRINPLIICRLGIDGELSNQYMQLGVKIVPIKIGYFNLFAWFRLYRLMKAENLEGICDFTGNFGGIPMLIGYLANIKNRVACYVGATNHFKEDFFRMTYNTIMNRLVSWFSTSILSNSKAALGFFFPGYSLDQPTKFSLMHNGIDIDRFLKSAKSLRGSLGIPSEAFVCGHVGRYNSAKNHDTAIEVAVQLCKKREDNYFIFCGKDVDLELAERVKMEGLQKKILLLGVRNDVSSILSSLDAFYFPSVTEGQPNALIEALISDLPFVASNIAPIQEMIPASHHNQLIDPLDHKRATEMLDGLRNCPTVDEWKCTDWAKEFFNANLRFSEFLKKMQT